MDELNNSKYVYKYSALGEERRREVESIRQEYADKTQGENRYEKLVKLDKKVDSVPKIVSLSVGIIGVLLFGLGLSLVLEFGMFLSGVIIATLGTGIMISAAFVRNIAHKQLLQKHRAEILTLAEQLLENKP